MNISELLQEKREEILALAEKHGARNVRIFGSAARGEAGPESDVDFLVELEPGRSLLDLGGLLMDLQDLLNAKVDVVTEKSLHWYIRDRVIQGAIPLVDQPEIFLELLQSASQKTEGAMKDDRLYLIHILECIDRVENFTEGGKEEFLTSALVQDAVLRNLQTMAESSRRLSDAMKRRHPEVPWRDIAGFRNILVHDYLDLDMPKVWEIVAEKLPVLKAAVAAVLQELGGI
jgi:uncharacterized protein with HEPN domain/predicted nucleotidyltransferase